MSKPTLPFYIGLPQWRHSSWNKIGINGLTDYSHFFNCIEGNTTFYALPSKEIVKSWRDKTDDTFRFCFKFPANISHKNQLRHSSNDIQTFLNCLAPLQQRIGQLWLQLPASFAADSLPYLQLFLRQLPTHFQYAVEVRHPIFFTKGNIERQFNQILLQYNVNRVILDSRALHQSAIITPNIVTARNKKPSLPVHVLATGQNPMIRFIGTDDFAVNKHYFIPWMKKITQWREKSIIPYLFIHTPDNASAPQQALQLWNLLQKEDRTIPIPSLSIKQRTLF